jgi:hypothetical protein
MKKMKHITLTLLGLLLCGRICADIAPNPIVVKGIYTIDNCKIQMTKEYVHADLYNDSSKVTCTFELYNFGDSTTIQVGFPEMNFQYWSIGQYNESDKTIFNIYVNDRALTDKEIGVPKELQNIYDIYMNVYYIEKEYIRKTDSIYKANNVLINRKGTIKYLSTQSYQETEKALKGLREWRESKPYLGSNLWNQFDEQMKRKNFPWYVWNVHFDKNERKVIKVSYSLPSGMAYGADYRYFKYILETGSGWYKEIENAEIKIQIHDIDFRTIEEISPIGFVKNENDKTIIWNLKNLEPNSNDNIYIKYFNPKERRHWERQKKKRERRYKARTTTAAKFQPGRFRDAKYFLPCILNCRGIKTSPSSSRPTI